MVKEKILLVGGGGHCKSCIDVLESTNRYEIIGIIDQPSRIGEEFCGYKILGSDEDLPNYFPDIKNVLITVGQIRNNNIRTRLFRETKNIGYNHPSIVASTAYISKHATLKEGSIIMHHAFVNAGATVGENTIVNTKVIIEHDVKVGNHCHISTASILNGEVSIGDNTFIGSNSCVNHGVTVGECSVVASHSLIRKNIVEPGIYYLNNILKRL